MYPHSTCGCDKTSTRVFYEARTMIMMIQGDFPAQWVAEGMSSTDSSRFFLLNTLITYTGVGNVLEGALAA